MGLLAPWLLLLGAAAAVPLLLHLMHRRPGPRVPFPALRYLQRAQRERGRRVRLRQLALLALRVLAVLLIALAAARPFRPSGAASHAPTAVAIVLDNSMSTGVAADGVRLFDRLRDVARATLDAAGPDDRFWLIAAAEPWRPAVTDDRDEIARALDDVDVVEADADLAAAVARAAELLRAGAGARAAEVHLLSDLQATALASAAEGADLPVIAWSPDGEPANHGIVDVDVGGGLPPRAGEAGQLSAAVHAATADTLTLRLWIDGQPASAARVSGDGAAVFSLPARAGGLVTGHVETEPDDLPADDRRPFAYRISPAPTVRIVGDAPFARQALAALEAGGRIRTGVAGTLDVLVAADAAGVADVPARTALVVVPPTDPLQLAALNLRLAAAGLPWRYEPAAGEGTAQFAPVDGDDELGGALAPVRVERAYDLVGTESAARADTLLQLGDGRPWALRVPRPGGGAAVLLASPLDPSATGVPASAAMVPLMDRLVGSWARTGGGASPTLRPGSTVELPGTATGVEAPDGTRTPVEGGAPWRAPARAGLYRVLSADSLLDVLAVAPAAAESRLERADEEALERALPNADVRRAGSTEEWTEVIFRRRRGAEWWRTLAALLVAALLVESVAAARRRGEDETA